MPTSRNSPGTTTVTACASGTTASSTRSWTVNSSSWSWGWGIAGRSTGQCLEDAGQCQLKAAHWLRCGGPTSCSRCQTCCRPGSDYRRLRVVVYRVMYVVDDDTITIERV